MTKRDPAAARVRHLGRGDPRIIPVEIETTFLVPLPLARDSPLPCVDDLPASTVVLLDAGDLLSIQDLLADLEIDHQRVETRRVRDIDWPRPRQLLVARWIAKL